VNVYRLDPIEPGHSKSRRPQINARGPDAKRGRLVARLPRRLARSILTSRISVNSHCHWSADRQWRARSWEVRLKAPHQREDHSNDQNDPDNADAAVAISVAVTPIGEDAAAPQATEWEQEKRTTRMTPISDSVVSYGLKDSNIQRERANAYLAAADLVDAERRKGGRIGFGGHCDRQYASAGRLGGQRDRRLTQLRKQQSALA